jgi:hypothetical protein
LLLQVQIKGFHTGVATIVDSRKRSHAWKSLADIVFAGAACEGAGVAGTTIQQAPTVTTLRCTPKASGQVNVVLQTLHGPVRFEAAAVELHGSADGLDIKEHPPLKRWEMPKLPPDFQFPAAKPPIVKDPAEEPYDPKKVWKW